MNLFNNDYLYGVFISKFLGSFIKLKGKYITIIIQWDRDTHCVFKYLFCLCTKWLCNWIEQKRNKRIKVSSLPHNTACGITNLSIISIGYFRILLKRGSTSCNKYEIYLYKKLWVVRT